MNDNKEFFELNEQELDSVIGGFNNRMVQDLNLQIVKYGTDEDRLMIRYTDRFNMNGREYATTIDLHHHINRGTTNIQILDKNHNWISLTNDQLRKLVYR